MNRLCERKLMTVNEVADAYNISVGSVRNFIHNKGENGFSMCMSQDSSRKILIDSELFEEWMSKRVRKKYTSVNRPCKDKRRRYDELAKFMIERDMKGYRGH